jgi:signal peptidase I
MRNYAMLNSFPPGIFLPRFCTGFLPPHSGSLLSSRRMNDFPHQADSPLPSVPAATSPPISHWKKATLAALLSFFLPGMGQLLNRQPRKAFIFAIITHILGALAAHTNWLLSFWSMVATIGGIIAWKLFAAGEAAYAAARTRKPESPIVLPWLTYSVIALVIIFSALAPSMAHLKHESGLSAYRISTNSMCPTMCTGERIVADSWAYHWNPPQRGDLVVFQFAPSDPAYIKRVIGLAGDVIAPGPTGTILVNGQPFIVPKPCGRGLIKIEFRLQNNAGDSAFCPITVPPGTFFVVGDNLTKSFDNRQTSLPAVTWDAIRGKPLYIYWSQNHSRISCSLQ